MRTIMLAIAAASIPLAAVTAVWTPAEARGKDRRYYTSENGVRYWRGDDGRYYCKRSNGTTGLIIGGAAGALLGREIDGGRNRATGTIVGAGTGALLGREISRKSRC